MRKSETFAESKQLLGYLVASSTMLYFDVSRYQSRKRPGWNSMYYFNNKFAYIFRQLEEIGLENFKEDVISMSFEDIFDVYYFTIALGGVPKPERYKPLELFKYLDWETTKEQFLESMNEECRYS